MGAFLLALLNGLAAIPKIAEYLNQAIQTIVGWWVSRQEHATLSAIADAAAYAARAQTDEERYEAASKWQKAFALGRASRSE